jgi:RNA polymerase sigma factor (sigma-70 family)
MSNGQLTLVLQHLRKLIRHQGAGEVEDTQLLTRFIRDRDQAAFEVLVWRHGPMILSLAQRLLHNPHDAEDVLQVTFLTLARKAGSISKRESLASWLYKVAYRIALRAKTRAAKTIVCPPVDRMHVAAAVDEAAWRELHPLLDAAIQRLPEKYRTAIVLCYLQGKTNREAAEQLGCPIGTVSTRLTRARELLRKQLLRGGVTLSAAALGTVLSENALACTMPAKLVALTIRAATMYSADQAAVGILSASVAGLLEQASKTTALSNFKIAALALTAAGILTVGVSALPRRYPAAPVISEQVKAAKPVHAQPDRADAPKPVTAPTPSTTTMVVKGQVLDPEGRPAPGARLYWPRWPEVTDWYVFDSGQIDCPERGVTGHDGRFRLELPRSEVPPDRDYSCLVAAAQGYGVDGRQLPKGDSPADLTLRLVKDHPIEGKILSTEGRPLTGVEVSVTNVSAWPEERLDAFLAGLKRDWMQGWPRDGRFFYLPKPSRSTHTDRDGRFRITGVGTERLATIRIKSPAIAQTALYVATRTGLDPAPYNEAAKNQVQQHPNNYPLPLLYGPTFTHVAIPGRTIEGVIREEPGAKPVAGVAIVVSAGLANSVRTVSDAQGRYQLAGLAKRKTYSLTIPSDASAPWLGRQIAVPDTPGMQPIKVNVEVPRGIIVTGRLRDKVTGDGVRGSVQFEPLRQGKPASWGRDSPSYPESRTTTDDTGRFQIKILPGKGVLYGSASAQARGPQGEPINIYRRVRLDPADRTTIGAHFYEVIDVPDDAAALKRDLFVDRGKTLNVRIQDPDGKPLAGATAAGIEDFGATAITLPGSDCLVYALDPTTPRRLLLYHSARNLAATLIVRGHEKEPLMVRLLPAATLTGRLLDPHGEPVVGADVGWDLRDFMAGSAFVHLYEKRGPVQTDKNGRFRWEGMIPGLKLFKASIYRGRTYMTAVPWQPPKQLAPGQTLDLGDLRVKPD